MVGTKNASPNKKRGAQLNQGGNYNPTGKGGFGDRPQDRNKHGQRNAKAVALTRELRVELLAELENEIDDGKGAKVSKRVLFIRGIVNDALKGDNWCRQFIAERTEGRVTQPIEQTIHSPLPVQAVDYGLAISPLAPHLTDKDQSDE